MQSDTWDRARPLIFAGLILLAVVALSLAVIQIRQVLATLFIGVILGVTLNPFVETMARLKVPRVPAILLVYFAVGALLAIVTAYGAYEFTQQDITD